MDARGYFGDKGNLWATKGWALSAITRNWIKTWRKNRPIESVLDFEIVEYELVEKSSSSFLKSATKKIKEILLVSIPEILLVRNALKDRKP